jgi:hypothetical protein
MRSTLSMMNEMHPMGSMPTATGCYRRTDEKEASHDVGGAAGGCDTVTIAVPHRPPAQ